MNPESFAQNNLYVRGLPKHCTADVVRRMFARYGKIGSFSLVDKPTFTTNIAYVGFLMPKHANQCLNQIIDCPDTAVHLGSGFEVFWHRSKNVDKVKEREMAKVSADVRLLQELTAGLNTSATAEGRSSDEKEMLSKFSADDLDDLRMCYDLVKESSSSAEMLTMTTENLQNLCETAGLTHENAQAKVEELVASKMLQSELDKGFEGFLCHCVLN